MTRSIDIREKVILLLGEKLRRVGVSEKELKDDFDLVRTGLVNSLEFVDIVATLEKEFNVEIDYEKALERNDLTLLGGLIRAFKISIDG